MIRESDVVITYITHSWGGAAQFAEIAKKKRKRIINVAEMMNSESILQIRLWPSAAQILFLGGN